MSPGASIGSRSIATRVLLVCAAATAALKALAFPDPAGAADAASIAKTRALSPVPVDGRLVSGPSRVARETAAMLGQRWRTEPALADADFGEWAGKSFDAIDRDALTGWLAAPHTAPPGGESLADVMARVASWLDGARHERGTTVAVTHAAVVRAALAHVLGIAPEATLAIDVAPLSIARLSFHDRWRFQELRLV